MQISHLSEHGGQSEKRLEIRNGESKREIKPWGRKGELNVRGFFSGKVVKFVMELTVTDQPFIHTEHKTFPRFCRSHPAVERAGDWKHHSHVAEKASRKKICRSVYRLTVPKLKKVIYGVPLGFMMGFKTLTIYIHDVCKFLLFAQTIQEYSANKKIKDLFVCY